MPDPGTAAIITAASAVIGTGISAIGQISNANAQAGQAGYNAQIARNNADAATNAANSDAADIRRRGALVMAEGSATAGAAGLIPSEGSPYEVLLDNAKSTELDAQRRLYQGKLQAAGYLSQAQMYGSQTNPTGGYLSAGASVISGGVKAYDILGKGSPNPTPYDTIGGLIADKNIA